MKLVLPFLLSLLLTAHVYASGEAVTYSVEGEEYEGYYTSANEGAPLLLLIHDWDGLTDYEIKRAEMLADLGYAVFAADLFGKGVRPTEVEDKKQHTGELYKDRTKMRNLLQSAFDEGVKKGGDGSRAVVFGYCFGGAAVLKWLDPDRRQRLLSRFTGDYPLLRVRITVK